MPAIRLENCLKEGTVKTAKAKNSRFLSAMNRRLGYGEAEAIAVALEMFADVVVLDDHAARNEGIRVGLTVRGTLSIIRRLLEIEKISMGPVELLYRLREINFRVKDRIYWEIFKSVKK